jgi:hypothetical protein
VASTPPISSSSSGLPAASCLPVAPTSAGREGGEGGEEGKRWGATHALARFGRIELNWVGSGEAALADTTAGRPAPGLARDARSFATCDM